VPSALTAASADALSGLAAKVDPTVGLLYTAAIQAANAASAAGLDALYVTAIGALLSDDAPANEVNIVWAARSSSTIDTTLMAHALTQKATGIGRVTLFSPPLSTLNIATVLGDASPGVGNARYREGIYNWPGFRTFVGDAVGLKIKGADGLLYDTGILDTPGAGWAAAILSNLAPERNPAQYRDPVKTVHGQRDRDPARDQRPRHERVQAAARQGRHGGPQ
jgi:hypothetical protein